MRLDSNKEKGNTGLGIAIAYYSANGYTVSIPLNDTQDYDLIVDKDNLPSCLEITSETQDEVIMGIKHKEYEIHGVQFHPEAEMTEAGHSILKNFINITKKKRNK